MNTLAEVAQALCRSLDRHLKNRLADEMARLSFGGTSIGYYDGGPTDGRRDYGSPVYGNPGYGGSGYYAPRVVQSGRCWVTTDSDRNYGYWGSCYR